MASIIRIFINWMLGIPWPFFKRVLILTSGFTWSRKGKWNIIFALLRQGIQPVFLGKIELDSNEVKGEHGNVQFPADYPDACIYEYCILREKLPVELDRVRWTEDLAFQGIIIAHQNTTEKIGKLLDYLRPVCVVYFQGFLLQSAVLRAEAVRRGMAILGVEYTANQGSLAWDNVSGYPVVYNLGASIYQRCQKVLTDQTVNDYADKNINSFKNSRRLEHQTPTTPFPGSSPRRRLLFIGQVYTDSSLVYGLKRSTPVQWMANLARFCEANQLDLLVKLHPKELNGTAPSTNLPYRSLTWRKMLEDPYLKASLDKGVLQVDHLNLYDTYSMIRSSDVVVTINSQAGLEAAIMGKPVVTLGKAFYGDMGFTYDVGECGEALDSVLQAALLAKNVNEMRLAARRFFYIFNEVYCRQNTPSSWAEIIRAAALGNSFKAPEKRSQVEHCAD